MKKLVNSLSLLFFLCYISSTTAQSIDTKRIDQLIDSKIQGIVPGVAVGIVKDGSIIYEEYFGYSNLEHEVKVDKKSRFNIASNAKQFTALCVLKLSLENKLSLEDDFRKYLPQFYPNLKTPIKIKHLLTHSSGIRDFYDLMSLEGKPWWTRVGLNNTAALKLLSKQQNLNFAPGTKYQYSNSGYTIMTALVEKVSGVSFDEYSQALFQSFDMNHSTFSTNYMAVIPHKTLPYNDWGDGAWQQYPMVIDLYGDGFLFTTLEDQLTWEVAIQKNKQSGASKLITQSQTKVPNANIINYGFGLEFNDYNGYEVIEHAGGTGSYGAHFTRFPADDLSIVVMSNNGNFWNTGIAHQIADILQTPKNTAVTNTYPERPASLSAKPSLSELIGNYSLKPDETIIEIVVEEGALYRKIYGRNPVKLLPIEGNLFAYENNELLKVAFTKNEKGGFDFTLYHPEIAPRKATFFNNAVHPEYYASLEGLYKGEGLDAEFKLTYKENGLYNIHIFKEDFEVKLLKKDYLKFSDYTLHVGYDLFGRVSEIMVDYNRNVGIKFSRTDKAGFKNTLSTKDGGQISVNTTAPNYGKGKGDILLTKTNTKGNEEWFKTYGGRSYDKASAVQITKDKGYIVVGSTSSFGNGNYDIWLIKTNEKGKEEWNKTYGGFLNEYGYAIQQTEDGGYMIKGKKQIENHNEKDWIIKTDKDGNEEWNKIVEPTESIQ